MMYSYSECINKYGSDYQIKREIKKGDLFQIDKGIYSDKKYCSEKDVIAAKYPDAVYTGESAFYYHGLSDVIPDIHILATKRSGTRIHDKAVHQVYIKDDIFDMGITSMDSDGTTIRIYNPERMLIELIRFRNRIPFDYYKEVIGNYRSRIDSLDFMKIEEYAAGIKGGSKIMDAIQMEVL